MVPEYRQAYNRDFSPEKYQAFLDQIARTHDHRPPFRIAETPVFIPNLLKSRLQEACEEINSVICQPNFKEMTTGAIRHLPLQTPNEDYHTRFLQMDFGICLDEHGDPIPQLIEVQGFPSLYFFQEMLAQAYRDHFDIPWHLRSHLSGMTSAQYIALLRDIIVGDIDPAQVVLLEIEPEKQTTYIDFLGAHHHLGIKVLCISKMKKRGRQLYYLDDHGHEIPILRIYNRVIFDELSQRDDLPRAFFFQDEVDVEWVGHPNWFFRISKYTMPLLHSRYVPPCFYLDQLDAYPDDLENYVLKPLYSFAGSGVQLHITAQDLGALRDRDNYILQRKVQYHPCIQTPNPNEASKAEIRMLMLWEQGQPRARIVNNLVRLSKGEMIGVKYNRDRDWVGASVGFFEP